MLILTASAADVKPIAAADLAAARMWNIKLPSIPLAPCFTPDETPAKTAGTADSWPDWTDEFTWELGPESTSALTSAWMSESTAIFLTRLALESIEDGQLDEALALYDHTDPEFRLSFDAFLVNSESPAPDWMTWLDLCRAGSPVSFPGKLVRTRRFIPTLEEDREAASLLNGGRSLGDSRRRKADFLPNNILTDADIYPLGCVS